MAVWTIWEHKKFGARQAERALFVRDGFSWSALIFGPFWLLRHGMIVVLIALTILAAGIIGTVATAVAPEVAQMVGLGLLVWFGFEARGLRRWALKRRGWQLTGVAEARRRRTAERRYYQDRLCETAAEPTSEVDVGHGYPLGHGPAIGAPDGVAARIAAGAS